MPKSFDINSATHGEHTFLKFAACFCLLHLGLSALLILYAPMTYSELAGFFVKVMSS